MMKRGDACLAYRVSWVYQDRGMLVITTDLSNHHKQSAWCRVLVLEHSTEAYEGVRVKDAHGFG